MYELVVNGKPVQVDASEATPLLSVLREQLELRGTRFGCGTEHCGACMVLIDGATAYSCTRMIESVAGKSVTTVEGLARNGTPVDEPFFRDTVLVHARETVDIGLVPQDPGRWMMHCHVLEHAEAGMMAFFEVR